MYLKVWCLLLTYYAVLTHGLPTLYKYNDNKLLEPDLVPVSSTVIPLPVYQVSYGLNVSPSLKDEKLKKPEGPITLVTVHTKKAKPQYKTSGDVSKIKEITQKQFKED